MPSRQLRGGLPAHGTRRSNDVGFLRIRHPQATPLKILARAKALATHRDDHALLPLPVLALLIGVHVKTLRAAARDGRLPVTYDTRTTFRHLRARARPLRERHAVIPLRGVGARMRAGLRASNRRARHLPMRYETGLPSSVIRFRT